jgi:hypothetical protein
MLCYPRSMTEQTKSGIKSAYERALERLAEQGIEKPREEAYSEETLKEMSAVRQRAEARLAEVEILHRDRRKAARTAADLEEADRKYRIDRERIEAERERDLGALRK